MLGLWYIIGNIFIRCLQTFLLFSSQFFTILMFKNIFKRYILYLRVGAVCDNWGAMLQHEQGSSESVGDSLYESYEDCICSIENIH